MSVAAVPRTWKKPPLIKSAWLRWTLVVGVVVYLALVIQTTPVNWTRVWEGLPRGAAFLSAFFPPDFVEPLGRDCRWHCGKPVDDGRFNRGRHRALNSGRHRGCKKYRSGPGLLFLPCRARGIAQLSGNHSCDLFRQAVRLRTVRRIRDALVRHHRLLRQAARRRHRRHGRNAGGGCAVVGRELAAVDQLRRATAGDAAHDRAWPLPFRHQFSRIRSDRHCRRRRHRGDTEHRI